MVQKPDGELCIQQKRETPWSRYKVGSGRVRGLEARGFTLIEVLIVMTIIALLVSLILSAVMNVRERAKIQDCQNNLREIGMALSFYDTYWKGWFPPAQDVEDDNLRPLYPKCVDTFEVFICLETINEVNEDKDLENNAIGGRGAGTGHSYEFMGHYLYDKDKTLLVTPTIKTRSGVDLRADKIWLIMDAMESGVPRVPDLTDNHYDSGGNVLFGDSHVEFVPRGQWSYSFQEGNGR